jgi:hypothetical protein
MVMELRSQYNSINAKIKCLGIFKIYYILKAQYEIC